MILFEGVGIHVDDIFMVDIVDGITVEIIWRDTSQPTLSIDFASEKNAKKKQKLLIKLINKKG